MPEADDNSTRARSPRFPSYDLQWGMNAISTLYKAESRHSFDRETAVQHLGYKGINGNSARAIASLGYYNLVEKSGSSGLKLSEMARELALTPDMSAEKVEMIQSCFVNAKGFSEIISHYGSVRELHTVSDINLRKELELRRGYSKEAASDFIIVLRANLEYIKSLTVATGTRGVSEELTEGTASFGQDNIDGEDVKQRSRYVAITQNPVKSVETIAVNLPNGSRAELTVTGTISDRSAEKLKSWLEKAVLPWIEFIKEDADEEFDDS